MPDRPSADRTAELLLWYARMPSRYESEGRRRDAPRVDPEVILKLALGRPVQFSEATRSEPGKAKVLQQAACAYVRLLFFRPDPTPYQVLGLEPGASPEEIKECFRLLMQLVHPDRQVGKRRWPDACAAQANWAYSLLRDQETRQSFEEEADARAALARAINRAAMASEAPPAPVVVWPRKSRIGSEPLAEPLLPEWLTAGVSGYAREHPAATAFGALFTIAALIIGATLWEGRDGSLVRVARENPPAPKSAVPTPMQASKESAASIARQADPAPLRSATPAAEHPIMLASNAPGVAVGGAPVDNALAPVESTPAPVDSAPTPVRQASSGTTQASAGAAGAPPATAVSSVSAASLLPAASPEPKASPVAAKPPSDVADAAPAPQLTAKVDATPAPEPAPVSVATKAPSVAPPLPLANAEVEALFANFVDAYERGRLDAFAALFDEDADTNLRRGRMAIRGEYDELFRLSQWRRMQLTRMSWRPVGDHAVANGEITVKIKWRDGRDVEQRVAVDMELVRRDGRVVIARLSHQAKTP